MKGPRTPINLSIAHGPVFLLSRVSANPIGAGFGPVLASLFRVESLLMVQ